MELVIVRHATLYQEVLWGCQEIPKEKRKKYHQQPNFPNNNYTKKSHNQVILHSITTLEPPTPKTTEIRFTVKFAYEAIQVFA